MIKVISFLLKAMYMPIGSHTELFILFPRLKILPCEEIPLLFLHAFAHACHLSPVFLLPSGVWFCNTLQYLSWGLDVTKSIKTTFQIGLDISSFRLSASPYVMAFHVAVQGHLHTYRFCDNVWTFILTDATFKSEEISETLSKVKIVACDSKLLQPHQP